MDNNRIKVAMICHFSNADVREHLPLDNRKLFRLMRKVLHMPGKRGVYGDIAPWDTGIINSVKERNDIELYVISAHTGLKKTVVSFLLDEIHYSFVRCEFANLLRKFVRDDNRWRRLNPMTPRVKRVVEKVNPDIILLVGAENAYYSSTILGLDNKVPIYLLCQTVYNNPEFSNIDSKNASTELEILKRVKYVGVYSKKHYDLLKTLDYKGSVFGFNWPVAKSIAFMPKPCDEKRYDFINFALHMSDDKGYPDCIKALSIVKIEHPDVQLCLVDGGPDNMRIELKQLVKNLGLESNVTFIPFFSEQNDLFQHLQTVRFAVLPCKVDHISGTQIQCMKYGLPVVCYKTTGTPLLNKHRECVLIAEMNNIEQLAEKMLLLMNNSAKADELRKNSIEYITARNEKSLGNMQRLVDNFHAIIDNFYNNSPIPQHQLFDPKKDEE